MHFLALSLFLGIALGEDHSTPPEGGIVVSASGDFSTVCIPTYHRVSHCSGDNGKRLCSNQETIDPRGRGLT